MPIIDPQDIKTLPADEAIAKGLLTVDPGTILERPCPFCGKALKRTAFRLGSVLTVLSRNYEKCTCDHADEAAKQFEEEYQAAERARKDREEAERMQRRIDAAFKSSEMPERWKWHSFANFDREGLTARSNATANRCDNYAHWLETAFKSHNLTYTPNGLFLYGPPGTGKTHLAAAVLNYIIANCANAVLAATMQELTARLKQTYNEDGEGEEQVIDTYTKVPLLLIDDLGSEQPTEWMCDRIFRIVNGRYNRNLPTIVTSNYDLAGLSKRLTPKRYGESGNYIDGQKIADRLAEMCVMCPLDGDSKRGNRRGNA